MKPRGRPRIGGPLDETARATVRLPARDFDRLCARASAERETLADVMRRAIARELRLPKIDTTK